MNPPQMADNSFADELNRRLAQATDLARQQRFLDARTAFYGCLEYVEQCRVMVRVDLVFDVWTNMIFCLIDAGQPANAIPYLNAMDALLDEWDSIPDKTMPPGFSRSHTLVRPLIPANLFFSIPEAFDSTQWKQRVAYYRTQLATELKTHEDIMQALWEFATFHCGPSKQNGDDVNWYVIKDSLNRFNRGQHDSHTGGLLYLSRNPVVVIGAAVTVEGCWATLMSEMYLEQIQRKVLKTELEQTFAADKRELRAFLENLVTDRVLQVAGDRFKVSLPQS